MQKYGGSSLADAGRIKEVARRIVETKKAGHDVVVAVSAMGDSTDNLLDLAEAVSPMPPARELDMLLTAGERISMALVAMAISDLGFTARSFTGSQAGVITDSVHGKAKIIDVTPGRISTAVEEGHVVIVAGFQGVSQHTKEITTLGRGGTDTTAVALAAALKADYCEIYTDVDGVFTADPRIVPSARRLDRVSYEEMLEMAASGAKILHLRCVEYARRYDMPVHVRSSFSQKEGTWVGPERPLTAGPLQPSEDLSTDTSEGAAPMEQPIIAGVAHDRSEAKITVVGVPDKVGEAARIFEALAAVEVNIDMVVQNVSAAATARTDISFTLPRTDGQTAVNALTTLKDEIGFEELLYNDHVGKVSLIGAGMRSHPGVTAKFFGALASVGVNIGMISTSEIRISVIVAESQVDDAVRATHTAFDLDSRDVEAVVYGGSGR
ncbi:aspartate kinase [Nocardioides salsibiostraticola]